MSEKKVVIARNREYDGRSFIELYWNNCEAAQAMIRKALEKKGINKVVYFSWANGTSVPNEQNMTKLRAALKKTFGLDTLPYVLFPSKEQRMEDAVKYKPLQGWQGDINWRTLKEEALKEQAKEEENE